MALGFVADFGPRPSEFRAARVVLGAGAPTTWSFIGWRVMTLYWGEPSVERICLVVPHGLTRAGWKQIAGRGPGADKTVRRLGRRWYRTRSFRIAGVF